MDIACRNRILSNDYYDFILDYRVADPVAGVDDYCVEMISSRGFIAYVSKEQIPPLSIATYTYATIPKLYTTVAITETTDVEALQSSGILQIQEGQLNLTGRGVLLGFVDTGIDLYSSSFRYSDGSTKIEAIWDQTIQSDTVPNGFDYGTLFSKEEINTLLSSTQNDSRNTTRTEYPVDQNGHGTAMAELAAAAAPDATLAVVKLKEAKQYLKDFYEVFATEGVYQENDIILGVEFLNRLAYSLKKPLVVCIGLGTNSGDHTGKSSLALLTNVLSLEQNRAFVLAGGNEGNARHHYSGSGAYSEVEIRVGEGVQGFMLELWGQSPDIYAVSFRSPSGEVVPKIPARLGTSDTFRFLYERTVVSVDYRLVEREAAEELVAIRFIAPTAGIWTIGVYSTNLYQGTFHMWLPITGLVSREVYFLQPDPFVTLVEPSNAISPITVTGYDDETGGFYAESSRGFSRDNTRKPDMSAPAVNLTTSRGLFTGTSMAAAITAGAVADFMEWAIIRENIPPIDGTDVRRYFINGAEREGGIVYPNRENGYGKMNLKGVFDSLTINV